MEERPFVLLFYAQVFGARCSAPLDKH